MPTAGRLMASILFAALSAYVTLLAMSYIPEGSYMHGVPYGNALIGFVCGWRGAAVGPEATPSRGVVAGLTTVCAIAFWALLIHSGARMIDFAMRGRYGGVTEGFIDTFQIMYDYARETAHTDVVTWALGGALFVGIVSAGADRRWT